jgi:hypothetical protein
MSALRRDPRFRALVNHLHRLGPRPIGEALITLSGNRERELLAVLEEFARLDPATVAAVGARNWPPLPVHAARRSEAA